MSSHSSTRNRPMPHSENTPVTAQLATLLNVSAEVAGAADESIVLQQIVTALVHTIGYKVAYFRLIEPDGSLETRACEGTTLNYVQNPAYRLPYGAGITGSVVRTRQPRAIADLSQETDFFFPDMRERESLGAMLAVPLLLKDDVLGTLTCYTERPHTFTGEEIQLVTALANLAAVALSNARYVHELQLLHDIGNELAREVEPMRVLNIIVKRAREITGADGAFVCVYDDERATFELDLVAGDGIGWSESLARRSRPRNDGISMTVLRDGMVRVPNVVDAQHEPLLGAPTRSELLKMGVQAFIGWRLFADEPVGVLYLDFKQSYRLPGPQHLRSFQTFTAQAAIAIQRTRLFNLRQRERDLIEITAQVTAQVSSQQHTWQKFLEEAMHLTKAKVGNISVISPDRQYLEQLASMGFPDNYRSTRHQVGGNSIQGWVAKHQKSVLIRNVRTDEDWRDVYFPGVPDTLSELTVPIYRTLPGKTDIKEVLGIINLEHPEEAAFGEDDLRLLERLCVHAKIAVQVAKDFERIEHQRRQLAALSRSAGVITASLELKPTLQAILQEAAILTNAHFATIQERRADNLHFLAVHPAERWEQLMLDIGEVMPLDGPGLTVRAARTASPVIENDVLNEPGYVNGSGKRTRSELAVPMLAENGQVLGVLNVENEQTGKFSQDDRDILESLAKLAVAAFQNAKQYQALETTQRQLEEQRRFAYIADFTIRLWHHLHNQLGLIPPHAKRVQETLGALASRADLPDLADTIDSLELIRWRAKEAIETVEKIRLPRNIETSAVNAGAAIRNAVDQISLPDSTQLIVNSVVDTIFVEASDMLSEVFRVLITNASDALPDGGTIEINSRLLSAHQVEISVRDNGHGIPAEQLSELRQFQVGFTSKRQPDHHVRGGFGLGLWWVNLFLRRLGGEIQVDSQTDGPERGSTFRLWLPLAKTSSNELDGAAS